MHDRFQVGFVSLVQGVPGGWDAHLDGVREGRRRVLVTGTSLGGAMQLFMGLWLFHVRVNSAERGEGEGEWEWLGP